ncbi:MAG TPA: hypothetical protein VHT73_19430 [Thermodesulfobacteriota bacterium]|nr:hypothetical protein [Thermodesulfobacteriota bacterium]
MKREEFFIFLTNDFISQTKGHPLGYQAARDALARCRRIEKVLKIDLDDVLIGDDLSLNCILNEIDSKRMEFKISGNLNNGLTSIKNGARRYNDFVGVKKASI